jgi:hypothetical protein
MSREHSRFQRHTPWISPIMSLGAVKRIDVSIFRNEWVESGARGLRLETIPICGTRNGITSPEAVLAVNG